MMPDFTHDCPVDSLILKEGRGMCYFLYLDVVAESKGSFPMPVGIISFHNYVRGHSFKEQTEEKRKLFPGCLCQRNAQNTR
jgi:hypothetical protein